MALQTFGVVAATIKADLPQVNVTTNGPLTSDRLTVLINQTGAEVCGVVDACYGNGTSDAIGADAGATYPVAYNNCARILVVLVRPRVLRAAHHVGDPAVLEDAELQAENLRKRLARNPQAEIGFVVGAAGDGGPSQVRTSTAALQIDPAAETSQTSERRFWGTRRRDQNPSRWRY